MTPEDQAESIRRRMAELRRELTCDMRDVSRSARAMTQPSFYIRKFPWTTLAVAAAVGYILVPKKKQIVQPDPELLAELVRKKQVKLDTSQVAKDSQGLLKSVVVMGLTWAARTGMSYVTQQLASAAMHKKEQSQPPAPSPLAQPWNPTH